MCILNLIKEKQPHDKVKEVLETHLHKEAKIHKFCLLLQYIPKRPKVSFGYSKTPHFIMAFPSIYREQIAKKEDRNKKPASESHILILNICKLHTINSSSQEILQKLREVCA